MRSLYPVVGLILVLSSSINAQTITSSGGGTGAWSDAASWSPATVPTVANSSSVVIAAGHTITVTDSRQIDQLTVSGNLIISNALQVNDGTGTDMTVNSTGVVTVANTGTLTLQFDPPPPPIFNATLLVNGRLNNAGTITNSAAARVTFGAGSIYDHQHTVAPGSIIQATWNATSTCQVTGYTTNGTAPGFLNQAFGHFTWDTPLMETYINLAGALTSVAGNLTIRNVPVAYIALVESGTYVLNVGGNFVIDNSYISVNSGGTATIHVTGNTTFSNNQDLSLVFDGTTTLDANGALTFDGGVNNLSYGGTGSIFVTVVRDFTLTNAPVLNNGGSGTYRITFDGSSVTPQNYVASDAFTDFSYVVQNGAQVNVSNTSAFMGAGGFTLQGGATLGVASTSGLAVGAAGNVQVSGTRTYTLNSNIIYNGTLAQNLGDEWGGSGALNGVSVNLEIANTSTTGVTNDIIGGTSLVGRLRLTRGSLNIGNSNTLIVSGDVEAFSSPTRIGTIGGDGTSDLQFVGAGTLTGTLNFTSGANSLNNFVIGRNQNITLGTDLTIANAGTLSFTGSGNLVIDGLTLTVNGNITQPGTGTISSSVNTSNLVIGGSGSLTALPLCTGCLFNNVTLSRGTGAYTWNANATVSGILDLTTGAFTHSSGLTMGTGSTFRRSAGTTYTGNVPNATTRFSVSYIGNLTTSNELPVDTDNLLENLTTAGDVTLNKNISINGNLNINSGTLIAGAHDITMLGATFAINGGTFTMASSNALIFSRVGSATTLSGSTIANAQFGNFTISTGASVSAPNANIFISGTWDNEGTFAANTGTVTFNSTNPNQDIDANGQSFFNFATAGATGTKTLTNAVDVNGALSIGAGTTLVAGANTINVAGTWSNLGTFNAGTGTVIFDGTTQAINNAGQSFNNLTLATTSSTKTLGQALDVNGNLVINTGVTLDVTASNHGVSVARNFTNNGTLNPRAGVVTFDGGNNQTISGTTNTTFNDITVNKANNSSAIFSTDQSIAGVLTLTDGIFNPNNHFTMLSSSTRDARIAPLGATASIAATNMTVQRYLPNTAGAQAYRYLSSPVVAGTVAGWKDDFPITGTFTDPSTVAEWPAFPNLQTNFPTLYRYNEAFPGSPALNSRYESYPVNGQSSSASVLTPGRGYAAYVRLNGPITIEQVGVATTGDVGIVVSNTAGTANDGWNLIGNPYASPIHWNNITRPPGVQTQIAFKDNTDNIGLGAGQYLYYTQGGAGIPGVFDGTIAAGQAFWVRNTASGTAPTLTFHETSKQPVNSPPFIREGIQEMLRINVANNTKADELLIGFNANAADAADVDYDAYKLTNDFINFSSVAEGGDEMAINIFNSLSCAREIPLHLKTVTPAGYVFTFTQIESFDAAVQIRLLDNFTHATTTITKEQNVYNFTVTTDPTSFGTDRFRLFVGYPTVDLATAVQASNVCQGSDASISIQAPQTGVVYYATLNGNTVSEQIVATSGSALSIPVPKANLSATNENHIVLMAKAGNCSAVPLSNTATISIENIPTVGNVTADARCGEGQLTLAASGAPSNGSYKWYLTEDATDAIAGETSSSFVTPVLSKTKTYFVSAVNSLGCESGRTAVTATVTYPYDIVGVTGAQGCTGSSVSLSATGAPSDGSYHWYVSQASAQPIPGQSAATFNTPELSASTTYYVAAVNAAGCEGARVPVTAQVLEVEDASIDVSGNTLSSGSVSGNQWYLNGTAIPGATGQTYVATQSGLYKLVVTSGSCSTQVEKEFAVTGDIDGDGLKGYVLYPNPTPGKIYVEVATTDPVTVSVKNQLGSEVTGSELKQDGEMRKGQLDISGHASGVYLVVIKHPDKTVIKKIVKN